MFGVAWSLLVIPTAVCLSADPPKKGKSVPAYVASTYDKPKVRGVHTHKAIVRSGPSDQHYPTQTLNKGAVVDVYMETSDGWSGIRPPQGAHDWIPAQVAYLLPGGNTAEIVADETPSWIGSDSKEHIDFQWVTSLKKTQIVHILGEQQKVTQDGKKQLWYRIAPPQGEFRWVRTSQLSDTISAPTTPQTDTSVQLANFVSTSSSEPPQNQAPEGKIVWSNEQEVLSQVEQQIRNEQTEARKGVPATSGEEVSFLEGADTEPLAVEQPHTQIRPIPMPSQSMRKMSEHQTDAMRQWDAMQNSGNPKLRVGPLQNVLGLVGISVVEAERAPVHAQIAQSYHARANQNHLGQVGPMSSSRIDRLPRPSRRYAGESGVIEERSRYEMNERYEEDYGYEGAVDVQGSHVPGTLGSPPASYSPGPSPRRDSTFSRWLHSQEPLFGGSATTSVQAHNEGNPITSERHAMGAMQDTNRGSPLTSGSGGASIPQQTSAWHAFPPSMRNMSEQSSSSPNAEATKASPESFQTPEIQSALVSLTQEVASPTEQWDLSSLRRQASDWIENGATAMVRGEARLLMERIDRFEALRQRTLGLMPSSSNLANSLPMNASRTPPSSGSMPGNPGVVTASAAESPTALGNVGMASYSEGQQSGDASGWLVQVHSSLPGQPQFALTDDAGNVVTYVQSTAALNLRRYLQQPVRVYGQRGYLPNLAAKQILADRVQRLR
jgi:SH3-like domain-containing protein